MKLTISDSNNLHGINKTILTLDDRWFDRDTLAAQLKLLVDSGQEFIEKAKILAAIRLGVMIDEDELELPSGPVILEDTKAMLELDKVLAEYNSVNLKPDNPAPPLTT